MYYSKNKYSSSDDIENMYDKLVEIDFDSIEEYNDAVNKQEPQQVFEWFIVADEGYKVFKNHGNPDVKFMEITFYGRTSYGQLLILCIEI